MSVRMDFRRGEKKARATPASPMSVEEIEKFYQSVFLPLVRRASWKHHLAREDARDIVQDAFVIALTRLERTGNPRAWLVQVVDHLSLNHRRKAVRRASLQEKWGAKRSGQSGRDEGLDG